MHILENIRVYNALFCSFSYEAVRPERMKEDKDNSLLPAIRSLPSGLISGGETGSFIS